MKHRKEMANKFIIGTVFFLLILTGCSKGDKNQDNDGSAKYYLKATIDGRKLNFHMVSFQGNENENRLEYIVIGGLESSPSNDNLNIDPPGIDFEISRPGGNISAGSYSTTSEVDMVARYFIQTPAGTSLYDTNWGKDLFVVKIDAISKRSISGLFSGTVRNESGKTIKITDGYFKLPYEEVINP